MGKFVILGKKVFRNWKSFQVDECTYLGRQCVKIFITLEISFPKINNTLKSPKSQKKKLISPTLAYRPGSCRSELQTEILSYNLLIHT